MSRGEFFIIDRRTWAEVCNLGLNEAVAYLVLAQGTGGNNRSTSWSIESLKTYTGMAFDRGKAAILRLKEGGFLVHSESHTPSRPRYELHTWPEVCKARKPALTLYQNLLVDEIRSGRTSRMTVSRRRELDQLCTAGVLCNPSYGEYRVVTETTRDALDPIFLPNALVVGAGEEDSPLRRLRRRGDLWTLRLFIDLYQEQNLRDDGGISPWILRGKFDRRKVGEYGSYLIWAYKEIEKTLWTSGPFTAHAARPKTTSDHPAWDSVIALESSGLLSFVPHIWERDHEQSEILFPYGVGDGAEQIEREIAASAHATAERLAFPERVAAAAKEGFNLLAPIRASCPDACMIGIPRLRYRPKTKRTGDWGSKDFKRLRCRRSGPVRHGMAGKACICYDTIDSVGTAAESDAKQSERRSTWVHDIASYFIKFRP
jgi:hypothetical protein